MICYISGKPLEDHEVAFAYYNEKHPDIAIHKKYNNEKLREEWLKHCKENMKETTIRCIPEISPEVISNHIDRTFPRS